MNLRRWLISLMLASIAVLCLNFTTAWAAFTRPCVRGNGTLFVQNQRLVPFFYPWVIDSCLDIEDIWRQQPGVGLVRDTRNYILSALVTNGRACMSNPQVPCVNAGGPIGRWLRAGGLGPFVGWTPTGCIASPGNSCAGHASSGPYLISPRTTWTYIGSYSLVPPMFPQYTRTAETAGYVMN